MVNITINNVTRMSEDALYIKLESLTPSDPLYTVIDAELERRASIAEENLRKRHKMQLESLKLTQAIQEELQIIFNGFRGKKTMILIENFGQEFIEDYYIDEQTCTVYSKVSHEIFNNPSSWEFDTIEKARCKMAKLIYYRIYDKFMRNATVDNLELLNRVLGGSNASTNIVDLNFRGVF